MVLSSPLEICILQASEQTWDLEVIAVKVMRVDRGREVGGKTTEALDIESWTYSHLV